MSSFVWLSSRDSFLWSLSMRRIILAIMGAASIFGCTDNTRARHFGGTETVVLTSGDKLVNVTWKENSLWVLTRKMRAEEQPETYSFSEKSGWGILEGQLIIKEGR